MKLEKNHCYLIKESKFYNSSVYMIRVHEVTKKCYRIKYENAEKPNWYMASRFDSENDVIEDLGVDYKYFRDKNIDEILEKNEERN